MNQKLGQILKTSKFDVTFERSNFDVVFFGNHKSQKVTTLGVVERAEENAYEMGKLIK